MKSFMKKLATFAVVFTLVFAAVPLSKASGSIQTNPRQFTYEDGKKPQKPDPSGLAGVKDSLSPAQRKLGTGLLQLVRPETMPSGKTRQGMIDEMEKNGQATKGSAQNGKFVVLANVYIQLEPGVDGNDITPYVAEITDTDIKSNLLAAKVDIEGLEKLAELQAVKQVQLIMPPITRTGSVLSQGDALHRADLARLEGDVTGAGVKIGIISDGVDHYPTAVATGDLPAGVTILRNDVGGDEGTAMLEIVHDLAPDAQLYFHDCGSNILQFNAAIDALVAQGCKIICDDIGWLLEPFYEDGIIARHIHDLLQANNVIYVSSAGNSADSHYQGQFYDDGHGYSDFSGGVDYPDLYAHIPAGDGIIVVLQWDEPFGAASSDYDLYLTSTDYSTIYASSTIVQDNDDDPLEAFLFTNPTADPIDVAIYVHAKSAPTPRNLEIYLFTRGNASNYSNNIVEADSIFGHPAVPGVIACGAIRHSSPTQIEYFSSQGPVTMLAGNRHKPDICGADGVSVTGAGGFPSTFYGTSAAAPHVAAIAALLLSKYPEKSVEQIKQYIVGGAVDLGGPGYDTVYGHGRTDAYAAMFYDSYTIKYNSQGGSAVSSISIPHNTTISEPTAPTRTGYAFGGWYRQPACTSAWYFNSDVVTANITLYAKWTVNTYTVTFDSQGGTTLDGRTVTFGAAYGPLPEPARAGYGFGGWYTGVNGTGTAVTGATVVTTAGNHTLYANWTQLSLNAPASAAAQSVSYNSVHISWAAVAAADGYEVWRATSSAGTYAPIATTSSTSITNTGLTTNKTYYYVVRACRNGAPNTYGPFSAVVSAKPVPAAPAATAAQASYNSIKVSWGAVAGATKYLVYRATSGTGTYKLLTTTSALSYTNKYLNTGATYYYKVRVYRLVGKTKVYGPYSPITSGNTTLGTPGSVKAATSNYFNIKVSWGKVAGASRYQVYRASAADGVYALVGTTSGSSYTNGNLANGATYYYKVRAYRTVSGKKVYGAYSGVVAGSTAHITVAVPANVMAVPATYSSNRITWGKVGGATRYELYRATSATGTYKLVTSTTALSYTNKSLATGREYFYKVRAYRTVGSRKITSGYSAVVSAMPVLTAPTKAKAARASATSIRVSWGAVSGRTRYELWRSDTADGTYAMIATTTSTYYTNTKLAAGTAWYYKVRAYRLVGKTKVYGPFTNVVSATP